MREGSVCSAPVSPRISRRRCMREGGQATSSVHPNPIPHGRHSGKNKSTARRMLAVGAQRHAPPLMFEFCWDRPLNCHAKGNKLTRRSPEAATQHHTCLTTLGADRCLMASALSIASGARYYTLSFYRRGCHHALGNLQKARCSTRGGTAPRACMDTLPAESQMFPGGANQTWAPNDNDGPKPIW